MERFFRLSDHHTTVRRELICGITTFLAMMYILFTNSDILSEAGMPWHGVFVATALSAAVCTIIVSVYANLPFGMAPGMGLNTVFSFTICASMGYHWKEALAITFLSGILHFIIMRTPARKAFVTAFPEYLRAASGAGLGLFIAYVGIKNAGFLTFHTAAGKYEILDGGTVISGTATVPSLIQGLTAPQMVAVIGLAVIVVLTALELKTGDKYAALPMGILVATFIGIPLSVTQFSDVPLKDLSMGAGFRQVFFSFFGSPGLLSIFSGPGVAFRTLFIMLILLLTSLLDSVGTMIGIGQIHNAKLFDQSDMKKFARKGASSKLDKALIGNSIGNVIAPLFGSSPATIYLESVTGIVSGGRTGLSGLVVGVLFLLCLPLAEFFRVIPVEAVAPVLILAGVSMLTRMRYINWRNYEESFPAFMVILFMPLSYSVLDGIALGVLTHVIIRLAMGKRREVHLTLILISAAYIALKFGGTFLMK